MEFTPIKPTVLKWGLYTGIALSIYTIILYVGNLMGNAFLPMLIYLISIGGIILAIREYKSLNQGFMPFNTGFKLSFLTGFLASLISLVVGQIYTTFINPNAMIDFMDLQRAKLEENPNMTEELIDMSMGMMEKMMDPMIAIPLGLVSAAVGAAIIGVILAAIMKNDPNA